MPIEFVQRLSITLTRKSLFIVLLMGLIVALIQVYIDFRDQTTHVQTRVNEIMDASAAAATRAVHHLDNELAQEVVNGLTKYDFLHHISITDDRGQLMAIFDSPITHSETTWLTRLISEYSTTYKRPLRHKSEMYEGLLTIKINNDRALSPIYKRSLYILGTGLARNLLLAVLLAFLYHYLLTRPLFSMAKNFSLVQRNRHSLSRLPYIKNHEHNELGQIVDSANALISALEKRENEVEQSEKQLRIILNASPNQVFALNRQGEFVFLNSATANFYKKNTKSLEGKNFFELHKNIDLHEAQEFSEHVKEAQLHPAAKYEREQTMKDAAGVEHVVHVSYIPYSLYDQDCVLVISSDVTARVDAENRVERLAYFDVLTQLPNKHQIHERLQEDIRESKKQLCYGALLFIDIDNFKRINDTLGHSTGDALLLKLSSRMQTQIRKSETLARLGGDEFILSVPSMSPDLHKTRDLVSNLADRLLKSIRQPVRLGTHEFEVSASIGIALYPDQSLDLDKLLSAADTAMYQAKRQGQDQFVIFESTMSDEVSRLLVLESDIRKGICEGQFTFYLQPLLDSHTREMVSAEALLRWQHPEKGQVLPGEFIGYLENSPMIGKVGEIILDQVCAFIYSCRNRGVMSRHTRIAINVSAREFYQNNFVEMVTSCLSKYHLHGSCLEIEITEGAALLHLEQALEKMHQLKELGIRFALDDFGTGYSSLNYLKQLPVDKIKIDKSFIKDITFDHQDAMLVSSIIAIANTLNLEVVAEGVETEDQAAWLNFHGRIQFQGFLFDRPMPQHEFEAHYLDENPTMAMPIY